MLTPFDITHYTRYGTSPSTSGTFGTITITITITRYGTSKYYFRNVWNVLEIINIIPFFISISIRVNFIFSPEGLRYNVFAGNRYQALRDSTLHYLLSLIIMPLSPAISRAGDEHREHVLVILLLLLLLSQEMNNIASMYSLSFMLDSVSILVSCFKIFKYLRIFASVTPLKDSDICRGV